MEWIKSIYDAKLDHVEHGQIQDFRGVTLVQRIGHKLENCITDNIVSKQAATIKSKWEFGNYTPSGLLIAIFVSATVLLM
jgi:hypothetical protein